MYYFIQHRALLFLYFVFLFVSCAPTASVKQRVTSTPYVIVPPIPTATAVLTSTLAPTNPNLIQALNIAPLATRRVFFTDWTEIKQQTNQMLLQGTSPLRARLDFGMSAGQGWEPISYCGGQRINAPQANWGWDFTDLLWDATIELGDDQRVCIAALPQDFDLTPMLKLYTERQFSSTTYRGTTILTSTQKLVLQRATDLDPAMFNADLLNIALLGNNRILLLSDNVDNIYTLLDVHEGIEPSLLTQDAVQSIAVALGPVAGGVVIPGTTACNDYQVDKLKVGLRGSKLRQQVTERIGDQLKAIHKYEALGIGYRYSDAQPINVIALHYDNAAIAREDKESRTAIIRDGISIISQKPYNTVFRVLNSQIQGTGLIIQLKNVRSDYVGISKMIWRRDMFIAACP